MQKSLERKIQTICQQLFNTDAAIELTRPSEQFGDFSINVALRLSKQLKRSPKEIGETLTNALKEQLADELSSVTVAGPGFINLTLKDKALLESLAESPDKSLQGQAVVIEYSDPNPFKVLHVGHLYTTVVGDAIANLLEAAGANVHRVNYGGDVGLHVAKTMWAILHKLGGENPAKLEDIPEAERADWMSDAYVEGNQIYETDESAKEQIKKYNKQVYELHKTNDHDSAFAQIYWTCRDWSYAAFDEFYQRINVKMERYYPESEIVDAGIKEVKDQIGKVFEESNGAIVFNGEKYGLHTRVFINSQGLPTYEAKEIGLLLKKHQDYNYDLSIIITASEQIDYMNVVYKAIEQFMPELAQSTKHLPHGMVRLAGGVKMSSRKGNIIRANEALDMTAEAERELTGKSDKTTTLGAVKYALLKTRLGSDLVYDLKESVSLEGNSGPYLQYAHARARSVIKKAGADSKTDLSVTDSLDENERMLARKLSEYPETVELATKEYMPHYICTYLYELAQSFNRFYEKSHVVGDPRQGLRLALVKLYADRLKDGLGLLGIEAPDAM